MAKSAAERKADQRERDAKDGLTQLNVKIHQSWRNDVLRFAAQCSEPKPRKKRQ